MFVSPAFRCATSFPRATRTARAGSGKCQSSNFLINIDREDAFERNKVDFFKKLAHPIHIIGSKSLTA